MAAHIRQSPGTEWLLTLGGTPDDWEAHIYAYANAANGVTLFLEGDDDANANDGDSYEGTALFILTPDEARALGQRLIAQADRVAIPA